MSSPGKEGGDGLVLGQESSLNGGVTGVWDLLEGVEVGFGGREWGRERERLLVVSVVVCFVEGTLGW